jgi:glycosyltransferase
VVTAVRNAAGTVASCLESVARQTHPVEHIVVDGASTDGTLAALEPWRARGVRLLSGPDRGIYDAMNKGVALATGAVVGTLNADDAYADERVIADVAALFEDPRVDCAYGDLVCVDARDPARVVRRWRAGPYGPGRMRNGWMPPHPTFFARRAHYERFGGYRLTLGTAADYELMLRFLLAGGLRAAYLPRVLVRMRAGGASSRSLAARLRANRMDREAWRVNGLRPRPWTLLLKPLRKIGQFAPRAGWGRRTP